MSGNTNHLNPCTLRSNMTKEDPKMPTEPSSDNCSHCLLNTDMSKNKKTRTSFFPSKPIFMNWSMKDMIHVLRYHSILCAFALSLFFFMGVEYTLSMIPSSSPPFDIGFRLTQRLHHQLASRPALNTLLAGLNTVRSWIIDWNFCWYIKTLDHGVWFLKKRFNVAGVCGHANNVYSLDLACRRQITSYHFDSLHVYM